jgi:hypothetical protein
VLIGLSGYARAGKDSVAAILHDLDGFERVAFADPVRELALAIDPFVFLDGPQRMKHQRLSEVVARLGWEQAKRHTDIRRLLQRIGTEGVRDILGENVWLDHWHDRVEDALLAGANIVATDVRFRNEADLIKSLGGQVWRIGRPGFEPINTHVSDTGVGALPVDRVIENAGTLEDLRATVATALVTLRQLRA